MSRQLDILFIHLNASKKIYQDLSKDHSAIEPPIWAAMLANHCRSRGFGAQILDCEAERLSYDRSVKIIKESSPELYVLSFMANSPPPQLRIWKGL